MKEVLTPPPLLPGKKHPCSCYIPVSINDDSSLNFTQLILCKNRKSVVAQQVLASNLRKQPPSQTPPSFSIPHPAFQTLPSFPDPTSFSRPRPVFQTPPSFPDPAQLSRPHPAFPDPAQLSRPCPVFQTPPSFSRPCPAFQVIQILA